MDHLQAIFSSLAFALPASFAFHSDGLFALGLFALVALLALKVEQTRRRVRQLEGQGR
jgi:hypothetical protein